MILRARYVLPVGAPVIVNGAVEVRDGVFVAVGPASDISGSPAEDFGDAVILPGLVNAHTHLELTRLAGLVPPSPDFTDWLRRLVVALLREPPTAETVALAVREGLAQSVAAGVTTVGDISRSPFWTRPVLADSPLRSVSFGEVIALGRRRGLLSERLDAAASETHASPRLRVGISPHAPYSVEREGMVACAQRAQADALPLCVHLAETPDEEAFTRRREGPFADYLTALGVWDDEVPTAGCGPVELAAGAGLLRPQTLVAHANYVSDADIALLAAGGSSVAYCPRTHAAFGHAPHRFRDMLAAGINVCIGTDSLASNPSLSVLDELRSLRRSCPDVAAGVLIGMATLGGAHALGCATQAGSIVAGKDADLLVVPLASDEALSWESILDGAQEPRAVYIGGGSRHPDPG
ncbi:MAG: amidohydrolase family protein [Planctomycetes bacterium]|nr:amidohydrolase family protein [Planctomycetota bacterium]